MILLPSLLPPVTVTNPPVVCPFCRSNNTVRIVLIVGKWVHFCFDCGRRFEEKEKPPDHGESAADGPRPESEPDL